MGGEQTGSRLSPIGRKLRYVDNSPASDTGRGLSMLRWNIMLPKIFGNSAWSVYIRMLLDMKLSLDYHLDMSALHFPLPQFTPVIEVIEKAVYDQSKYDESILDPEQVSPFHLEGAVWDFHYKAAEKCIPAYKSGGKTLRTIHEYMRDMLADRGIRKEYAEGLFDTWAIVEAKAFFTSYVGFAIVDVAVVGERKTSASHITARSFTDWKTEKRAETHHLYECHVDFARVDYARVISKEEGIDFNWMRQCSDEFIKRLEDFRNRVGGLTLTVPYPTTILGSSQPPPVTFPINMQRLVWMRKRDDMHWKGGGHQIKLQKVINRVKRVLDRHGVIAQVRMMYINFAEELAYLEHPPEEEKKPEEWGRTKEWKKALTEDDLFLKYKKWGLEENILREIASVVRV